jgi:hypothetical protein
MNNQKGPGSAFQADERGVRLSSSAPIFKGNTMTKILLFLLLFVMLSGCVVEPVGYSSGYYGPGYHYYGGGYHHEVFRR